MVTAADITAVTTGGVGCDALKTIASLMSNLSEHWLIKEVTAKSPRPSYNKVPTAVSEGN